AEAAPQDLLGEIAVDAIVIALFVDRLSLDDNSDIAPRVVPGRIRRNLLVQLERKTGSRSRILRRPPEDGIRERRDRLLAHPRDERDPRRRRRAETDRHRRRDARRPASRPRRPRDPRARLGGERDRRRRELGLELALELRAERLDLRARRAPARVPLERALE